MEPPGGMSSIDGLGAAGHEHLGQQHELWPTADLEMHVHHDVTHGCTMGHGFVSDWMAMTPEAEEIPLYTGNSKWQELEDRPWEIDWDDLRDCDRELHHGTAAATQDALDHRATAIPAASVVRNSDPGCMGLSNRA